MTELRCRCRSRLWSPALNPGCGGGGPDGAPPGGYPPADQPKNLPRYLVRVSFALERPMFAALNAVCSVLSELWPGVRGLRPS